LRLVRTLQGCESLYLMTASIKASVLALTWSAVLIFLIQMSIALVLNELLQPFLASEHNSEEVCHRVYRYFGTFSKAFLTMFEFMLANWPPASRVLTEDVSEWSVIFILGYQCICGFAVVKVIMGVFLQVTFNVAATDDIIMVSQKERAINNHTTKMSRLFMAADQDGNGVLDKEEFKDMVVDPIVRQWLASMDCDVSLFARDSDMLFNLVSGGDGQLTAEQLVKGVARMQGVARSIDLAVFADQNREVTDILKQVSQDLDELKGYMVQAGAKEDEAAQKVLAQAKQAQAEESEARRRRSTLTRRSSFSSSTVTGVCSPSQRGSSRPSRRFSTMENSKCSAVTEEMIKENSMADLPRNSHSFPVPEASTEPRYSSASDAMSSAMKGVMERVGGGVDRRKTVSQMMFRSNTRTSFGDIEEVQQQKRSRCRPYKVFRTVVRSHPFEALFGALIFINTLVMSLEVQYNGMQVGYTLQYPDETRPAREVWPWAEDFFFYTNWTFLVIFALEIVLKILAFCGEFFTDLWNYFDVAIVSCGFVEAAMTGSIPINTGMLRFARLTRLLRMLRLVRAMKEFDSLHLMITSIKGSIMALLWSSALMFVVQMLIALVLNTMLEGYLLDTTQTTEDRHEIYMYFGNFSKAMLTMFEITLANWIPCARSLTERVDEFYVLFALAHKFIIGFAVVMVITGVFLNETFRVSATDDTIMITQKQRQIITHTKKMSVLFKAADEDGNGILDREEFKGMMEDPSVVTWLSSMGLEVNDADTLFTMVAKDAERDSEITAVELVKSVAHLKGNAKSLDMAVVMQENRGLLDDVQNLKLQWKHVQMLRSRGARQGRRGGAGIFSHTPTNA